MKSKVVKTFLSLLLAGAMAVSMIGCGEDKEQSNSEAVSEKDSESESEKEAKDPVTLVWYYCNGAGEQEDTQKVEERVNELLKDVEGLEHVSIDLVPGTFDYAQEVLLAQTSGKQIDILHTYRLSYTTEIANGTYIAIDDYLESEEFAALADELPDWLWNNMKVNGQTYIVPSYQMAATERYIVIPTEYVQYLTDEELEFLKNLNVTTENAAEMTEKLCQLNENLTIAIREATGEDWYCSPLGEGYLDATNMIQYDRIDKNSGVIVQAGTTDVEQNVMQDWFKIACEYAAKWVEEGLLPSDAAVQDRSGWDYNKGETAKYAFSFGVQSYGDVEAKTEESTGMDVTVFPWHDNMFIESSWGAGGNGITANCEHPYEAMLFLQLINTEAGQEIYNTIVWGLEGKHWEWEDQSINRIKTLEFDGSQGGSDTTYCGFKWIIGNTKYQWLNQAVSDHEIDEMVEINENPDNIVSLISGFKVDLTPVETEISQMQAVMTEYRDALIYGSYGANWEDYYNECVAKLEAAGWADVEKEIQNQLDAHLATMK